MVVLLRFQVQKSYASLSDPGELLSIGLLEQLSKGTIQRAQFDREY